MKPVWKWIIGIVIALAVIALVVGAVFLVRTYLPMNRVVTQVQPGFTPRGFDDRGFPGQRFLMPRGNMHGFGMMGWGMMPFGGIFSGLFSLGLLALVVLGIIWLVRSVRTPKQTVAMKTCGNCGKPVQEDWKNCPYCGKKI